MFEHTFRTGSSCSANGETAQSMQLIPLSCDLEYMTHQIRDSFLSPAFHFSKSFHATHLILSMVVVVGWFFFSFFFLSALKLFRETPETTYAERRMYPADMLFLFQELTFSSLWLTNTRDIILIVVWNKIKRGRETEVFENLKSNFSYTLGSCLILWLDY